MSAWPPRWEDTFVNRETGVPAHYRAVRSELRKRAFFLALSNREQLELNEALYTIDMTASSAARELGNSPWTTAELFSLEPPKGADPFGGAKETQKYNQWLRYREHQYCIRFCRRARRAVLTGEWGKAIHAALYAGNHLNGALALTAQKSLPGLSGGSLSNKLRAERNREIALREAHDLRAARTTLGKGYNTRSIAHEIAERHVGEKGFPRFEAVRRLLGQDKSWESRARFPNAAVGRIADPP